MRQSLVPVLVLTAVALSSSNVLPVLPAHPLQPIPINSHQYDNILSNILRYNRDDLDNMFNKPRTSQSNRLLKKASKYMNTNNDRAGEISGTITEEDNYDDEGFRKEQWHNYPRQLDRLHEYLLNYHNGNVKRSNDIVDASIEDHGSPETVDSTGDTSTNEYLLDSNDRNNIYDTPAAATNPLLIFKVHLSSLSNRLRNSQEVKPEESFRTELKKRLYKETDDMDRRLFTKELNPIAKVKREDETLEDIESSEENSASEKKTVNKRLFSLWSRLQNLSHKGHELPHRRHLAYYGFPGPDSDGGGVLTAETRATMMRPPGSPLRWG